MFFLLKSCTRGLSGSALKISLSIHYTGEEVRISRKTGKNKVRESGRLHACVT